MSTNKDIIAYIKDTVKGLEKEVADTIDAKINLTFQNSNLTTMSPRISAKLWKYYNLIYQL